MTVKYWLYCIIAKDNDIRELLVGKDGLLIKAKFETVKDLLNEYPTNNNEVWYFNESKDREIAELEDDEYITANPKLVWRAGFEIIS